MEEREPAFSGLNRRSFLQLSGVTMASLPLLHFAQAHAATTGAAPAMASKLASWQDLYRAALDAGIASRRDRTAGSTAAARATSTSTSRTAIVVREEQTASYDRVRARRSRFQSARLPEGRLLHGSDVRPEPTHGAAQARRRARRRSSGSRISWEQALREIAEKLVDDRRDATAPTAIIHDLGPALRPRSDHRRRASASSAWPGHALRRLGGDRRSEPSAPRSRSAFPTSAERSDEWFLSDYLWSCG